MKKPLVVSSGSVIHLEARVDFGPGVSPRIYMDQCYGTSSGWPGHSRRAYVVVNSQGLVLRSAWSCQTTWWGERSWGQPGNVPDLFLGLPRCLHGPSLGSVSVQHQRGASVLQFSILAPVLEVEPEEEVRLGWSRLPGGGSPPWGDLGVPKALSLCGHSCCPPLLPGGEA